MKGKRLSARELRIKAEKDSGQRRLLFKELCDHLRKGFSLDSYKNLSDRTIRDWLKAYPNEFVEEEMIDAIREGKANWEDIGYRQANGSCMGNSRSWYYNMANRYGWREKLDVQAEHKGNLNVSIVSYASANKPSDT